MEGPIYDDVLVRRIARLPGFARAGGRIRETVLGCVNARLRRDIEDDRIVFWPEGANIRMPIPFRGSADGVRDHGEIPLSELAALARPMMLEGANTGEIVRRMAAYFGLNRLSGTSRVRFAAAVDLAHSDDQA